MISCYFMHVCPITSDAGSFADVVDMALSSERFCEVRAEQPIAWNRQACLQFRISKKLERDF